MCLLRRLLLRAAASRGWSVAAVVWLAAAGLAIICGAWEVLCIVAITCPLLLLVVSSERPAPDGRPLLTWEDRKLLAKHGPAAAGDMAAVLNVSLDRHALEVAKDALLKLLGRLDAPTYRALNHSERQDLRRLLASTDNVALAVALLSMFERVADVDALPYVRAMVSSSDRVARDPRVVEASTRCAAILEGVGRQQHDATTLLRPSELDASTSLLRPAGSCTSTPDEQLLRPVHHSPEQTAGRRSAAVAHENPPCDSPGSS